MSAKRVSPQRGLLAGLLALVTFVSGAVAVTAHGAGVTASSSPAALTSGDRDGDGVTVEFRGRHR
ncbi:MAG TPA: hypothetical protein VI300_27930 [Solirubrobacter sp.]